MGAPSIRFRRQRGAATVELALSMLVFIPIFLYAIFLNDMLGYRLDLQEGVLSTGWDFTPQDYTKAGENPDVQHFARLMWCDHHSGIESFSSDDDGQAPDCTGEAHHKAMAAHVCWMNDNAKQVTCDAPDTSVGNNFTDPVASSFASSYTQGGLIQCSGREVVQNYFLPEKYLPEFSKTNMTLHQWSGDYHANSQAGKATDTYYLAEQKFAVVQDTWALDESPTINPGDKSGGKFYDRMKSIYSGNPAYGAFAAAYANFTAQAVSNQLLDPLAVGDDPLTPNLSDRAGSSSSNAPITINQMSGSGSYNTTPWQDWENNLDQAAWNARGQYYLGCQSEEGC